MKVICDCGAEMNPVVDEEGNPEYWFPVVTVAYMGQTRFQGAGFYFDCPECESAFCVIPRFPKK